MDGGFDGGTLAGHDAAAPKPDSGSDGPVDAGSALDAGHCERGPDGKPLISLEALCRGRCPVDRAEAEEWVDTHNDGDGGCEVAISSCCGVDTVSQDCLIHGARWSFDSTTGQLIGASYSNDTPRNIEGCEAFGFSAGEPPPLCDSPFVQSLCASDAG